jgi:hypothetical protein
MGLVYIGPFYVYLGMDYQRYIIARHANFKLLHQISIIQQPVPVIHLDSSAHGQQSRRKPQSYMRDWGWWTSLGPGKGPVQPVACP